MRDQHQFNRNVYSSIGREASTWCPECLEVRKSKARIPRCWLCRTPLEPIPDFPKCLRCGSTMSVFDNEHGYELLCSCGYNYSGTSNTTKLIEAYLSMVRDVTKRIMSENLSCAVIADIATVRVSNDPETIEAYVPRGENAFDSLGPVVYILPRSACDEC